MSTSTRAPLSERAAATLLERALGSPAVLVAYDAHGKPVRTLGVDAAPTLDAEQRSALASGRSVELAGYTAVAALDEGGLLWAALRPADDLRDLPRFTHHLVHQLRNALSSLKLAAQSLGRAAGLNDRERKRADIALREVARMERVLSTATEFVVGAPSQTGPLVPADAVRSAAAALGPDLQARALTLELVFSTEVRNLRGDLARLELAVQNLLAHACRVMADGGSLRLQLEEHGGVPRLLLTSAGAKPSRVAVSTSGRLELVLPAQVARDLGGELEVFDAGPGLFLVLWLGAKSGDERGHAALGG
ncbi:MAG: HAMP domain-containing histidine kinase [Deltaproteobacteria bacterium]|nr:HAMP domain-containing histidine kinase [Deltaproteobacteria bacterium]